MVDVDGVRERMESRRKDQVREDRINDDLAKFGYRLVPPHARFVTCNACGVAVPYLSVALESHYWQVHHPVKYRTAKATLKAAAFLARVGKNAESRRRARAKGRP